MSDSETGSYLDQYIAANTVPTTSESPLDDKPPPGPTAADFTNLTSTVVDSLAAMQANSQASQAAFIEALNKLNTAPAVATEAEPSLADSYAKKLESLQLTQEQMDSARQSLPIIQQVAEQEALKNDMQLVTQLQEMQKTVAKQNEALQNLQAQRDTDTVSTKDSIAMAALPQFKDAVGSDQFNEWLDRPIDAYAGMRPRALWDHARSPNAPGDALVKVVQSFLASELGAGFRNQGGGTAMPDTTSAAHTSGGSQTFDRSKILDELNGMESDYLYGGGKKVTSEEYNAMLEKVLAASQQR